MTVILVLATFLVFVVVDYVLNRRKTVVTVPVEASPSAAHSGDGYVDGFLAPRNISYHAGHGWLVRERKNVVRVGADEFAAALVGKVDRIELPRPGQWIRQGQKVLAFIRDGEKTEMVSPTEGEVMAVNTEVLRDPATLRQDPYGKGWLLTVNVPAGGLPPTDIAIVVECFGAPPASCEFTTMAYVPAEAFNGTPIMAVTVDWAGPTVIGPAGFNPQVAPAKLLASQLMLTAPL